MTFSFVFQAASLVNIGDSIGISPAIVALLLLLAENTFKKLGDSTRLLARPETLGFLGLATAYSVVSAFLNPRIFAGAPVSSPRYGGLVSLAWETGHLNQAAYLVLAVALFYVVSCRTSFDELRKAIDWFVIACVFAALVAAYQVAGLPFPREIFATSPSYAIFHVYDIGSFTRANSTFTEAASASSTMAVALAIVLWRTLSGQYSLLNLMRCLVLLAGIVLTLSTTGYLCLAFLLLVSFLRYVSYWRGGFQSRAVKPLLVIPCLLVFLGFSTSDAQRERLGGLLDSVVFQKKESQSYRERHEWNDYAWQSAAATSWFGVGFGVCRGSSVVPTTFGNIGIPGAGLFGLFLLSVIRSSLRAVSDSDRLERQSVLFGLSACLGCMIISGPEMTSPLLWFLLGFCGKGSPSFRRQRHREIPRSAYTPSLVY